MAERIQGSIALNKNILITGYPKTGKTTLIKKLIENCSKTITGFYTEEIMNTRGVRVGFRVMTLSTDEPGVLAHMNIKTGWKVGKYFVDIHEFERVILPELNVEAEIIIIDEIGKMELYSEKFKEKLVECLDKGNVVATITMKGGGKFVKEIKNREDSDLYYVTEKNRNKIAKIIQAKLCD